ncbi:MAG: O-succinylhomoserine sulfhydrylase [Saprospiraceae bacterium]|nr:O-succinylhomoserine sulfhydrylase [Saprospiraceae bacterium]MBP6567658.1 O-succinylhomoserine sulfhydrylase [Saprospiraceae bacterium]
MKFETKAIRTQTDRSQHHEHSTPIFATSSFVFDDAEHMRALFANEETGNIYSRFTNPSVREFELKMAALEEGENCIATTTGMAAIFATFASLLKSGDHLLMSRAVFGSTFKINDDYLAKWGIEYDYLNPLDMHQWESLVKPTTRLLYLETPSNPGLDIIDLKAASDFCKHHDILLVVDNCFATPYLQRPLTVGADISIHSATKYIDGQGRVMGGAIITSNEIIEKIYPFMKNAGPSLSPFNAWVLSKSLETLAIRMDRHCENALKVAQWLESRPEVSVVKYPFLPSNAGYETAIKQMKAGGGMISFELKGGLLAGVKMIDSRQMMSLSANLGDTRTIITHPASSTHSKLTPEQRHAAGISDGLIRLSVGLEHVTDIIDDLHLS